MVNNRFCLYLCLILSHVLSLHACADTILNIDRASQFSRGVTFVPGLIDHELFSDADHKKRICSALMNDTLSNLIQHNKLRDSFGQNFTPELFLDYSKQDPLWLIRDCAAKYCGLNRIDYPQRRPYFETKVADHIRDHFPDTTKPLTIAFFAPGDLCTELMVLLRTQLPNVNIVLIDKCWPSEFKEIVRANGPRIPLQIQDANEKRKKWFAFNIARLAQFVQCMQSYEKTQNSVIIYSNADEYIADCKDNSTLQSDIIICADLCEGEPVTDLPGIRDYRRLALYALKSGGYSYTCSAVSDLPMFGEIVKEDVRSWRDILTWRKLYMYLLVVGTHLLNGGTRSTPPVLIEIAQKRIADEILVEPATATQVSI